MCRWVWKTNCRFELKKKIFNKPIKYAFEMIESVCKYDFEKLVFYDLAIEMSKIMKYNKSVQKQA